MSIINKVIIGGLSTLTTASIIESKMQKYDTQSLEPTDTVTIIVSSLNESKYIDTCLSSIRDQSIIQEYPDKFEIILSDSCSTDGTIELAENYVDRILITPRGKLTSKNIATKEAKGNIIVSTDADTFYRKFWLNSLLKPFFDYSNFNYNNVVGTYGSTFDYTTSIPGPLFSIGENVYNMLFVPNRMTGRNSAYMKHAFYLAGGFNENINQLNIWDMFDEEERLFGNRLAKFGKIIYKMNASCDHLGGPKSMGRIGIGDKKFIEKSQFGVDRF